MNNYRILLGLLATIVLACASQAQAATITTGVDNTQSTTGKNDHGCLQQLVTAITDGENCMYDGGQNVVEWPPGSGIMPANPFGESTGPFSQAQFYDYGTTPLSYDDVATNSFTPVSGDAKINQVINGSITIDDQGNADETDDEISFTLTMTSPDGGDIVRNLGSQVADKYTSMTQVLLPTVADFPPAANALGGFDYVIGSEGFPLLLTFTDTSANESSPGLGDGPCVGQTFGDMECDAAFDTNLATTGGDPLRWRFYDDGSTPPLNTCSQPGIDTDPPAPCWRPTDGSNFFGLPTPPGSV